MSESPKTAKIKVSAFLRMWNTLVTIGGRTSSAPEYELDVQLCLAMYEAQSERISATKEKVRKSHLVKDGAKLRIKDRLGLDDKLQRIDDSLITIRLPEKLLTKAHLPAVSDDEGDLKNRAGNATFGIALGPIFDMELGKSKKDLLTPLADDGLDALDAIAGEPVEELAPLAEVVAPRPASTEPPKPEAD